MEELKQFFTSETANIVFGGLLGAIITIIVQRKHAKADERSSEQNLLSAIRCEIIGLKELLEENHKELVSREFEVENNIINSIFVINQNYFSFFDQNFINFHKISSQELQLKIQHLVLKGKSYVDSISLHNQMLGQFIEFGTRFQHTNNNYDLAKARQYLTMLQDYDKQLCDSAVSLKDNLIEIDKMIEAHLMISKASLNKIKISLLISLLVLVSWCYLQFL